MARQPRFIEDDEPVVRRAAHESRPAVKEPEETAPEIDAAPDIDVPQEDAPEKPEESGRAKIRYEDARYEGNTYEYEGYDDGGGKSSGKRIALLIVALLLGFAIVGAGVYALVHFVIMPDKNDTAAVAETEEPTMPDEPTLSPVPTQPPTQAPTAAPEPDYAALAETYMADMSDYDKICQLFIVTPEVLTASLDESGGGGAVTVAGSMTEESLEDYPVGGIIYFADNLQDTEQTQTMIENSQDYAATPLFIAVDEEGGDVARVADKLHTKEFDPMFTYKDDGEETAHDNAEIIGSNLSGLGFNMDNAPVADVFSNPDNTVIGERAYSDDFAQAAKLVASAVKGFHDGGVICVLKHFPGHGSSEEDSHEELAHVTTTLEDLKKNELQPFKAGIQAGADMVMVGHLVVEDLDPDLPATLSPKVVPELLRKELGYDGIVISDSMSMDSINYSYADIVKGLFAADVDIILMPDDLDSYIEAIEDALENGDITQEQIDNKVKKILALKIKHGILKVDAPAATPATPATPAAPAATEAPTQQVPAINNDDAATAIPGVVISQPTVAA